ncbi:ketosynthase chain-length factor [Paractinoplanes ferrugineus]|uniref:Actinorhodin polyketide beta-ketoacyl synthase n=1 Tax=Paractinoplanes ferrugineus TaxID=113564 RepID=A0A919J6W3_9ACTN|nr:ketosynthase chain-length factor [Actinoplanes ferrugineus]GIE13719.1 actinorhodin polyketide beta-ketoacyl synthase [Actinoplanes ferrugineus]
MTAVVTGVGVAAATGLSLSAHWEQVLEGRSAIGPITRFDSSRYPVKLAGEAGDFHTAEHVPSRIAVQTDRWTHLGLTAAAQALADAGIEPADQPEYEMAVVTASSSGGTEFGQREIHRLWSKGPDHVGAYQSIAWFYAATTGQISIRHGMRGSCGVVCTEQAGGLDAAARSRRLLSNGARMVLTGGTDASLCPYGLTAQLTTGRLSTQTDPAVAYRPFDRQADGYVPGEGGALFVMEEESAAVARGAPQIYGRLSGFASTFDPAPGSGRPPGLRRAAELALADAGLGPADIGVVFADAVGVPELDRQEAEAITALFGARGVPVTAPKTMTGRLYAGGAALDLVTAMLAVRDEVLPPTVGVVEPAPGYDLDLVLRARPAPVTAALVLARGYGGFNAAAVVTTTRS